MNSASKNPDIRAFTDTDRANAADEIRKVPLLGFSTSNEGFPSGGAVTDRRHRTVIIDGRQFIFKLYGEGPLVPAGYTLEDATLMCDATRDYSRLLENSGINVPVLKAVRPVIYKDTSPKTYAVGVLQEQIHDGVNAQTLAETDGMSDDFVVRLHGAILSATKRVIDSPSAYRPKTPMEAPTGFDNRTDNFVLDKDGRLFFVDPYPPFQLAADGKFAVDAPMRRSISEVDFDLVHEVTCGRLFLYCRPLLFLQMARPHLRGTLEAQALGFVRQNEHPEVAQAIEAEIAGGYPQYKSKSPEVARGLIVIQ
ncbi:Uncharacterised protein [uncultured archaeon]|nr:Uncharacterised protein [uncultured archaeon]